MTPMHGIASRGDLPLPFGLVLGGAAAVLLVTFWVVLFAWRVPRFRDHTGTEMPRLTRLVSAGGAVSVSGINLGLVKWLRR